MGKLKDMIKLQGIPIVDGFSPILSLVPKHLYALTQGLVDPVILGAMYLTAYVDSNIYLLKNYKKDPQILNFLELFSLKSFKDFF
jgi:hypothetical protein